LVAWNESFEDGAVADFVIMLFHDLVFINIDELLLFEWNFIFLLVSCTINTVLGFTS
jgi:hypothetical protein